MTSQSRSADDIFARFFGFNSSNQNRRETGISSRSADDIFAGFFGSNSPNQNRRETRISSRSADDIFAGFFGFNSPNQKRRETRISSRSADNIFVRFFGSNSPNQNRRETGISSRSADDIFAGFFGSNSPNQNRRETRISSRSADDIFAGFFGFNSPNQNRRETRISGISSRSADDIFAEFFGSNSPNQNRRETGISSRSADDIFAGFFGSNSPNQNRREIGISGISSRSADDIFAEFFGSNSPNQNRRETGISSRSADDIFAGFFGSNSLNQNKRGRGISSNINGDDNDISRSFDQSFGVSAPGKDPAIKHTLPCSLEELYQGATKRVKITREVADRNGPNQNRKGTEFSNNRDDDCIVRSFEESVVVSAPGKDPAIKHTLPCSLEELYQGATKTVKITRQVADRRGLTREIEEILTIDTKPGWKKGTEITFEEKGNERPNVTPADVVFIVDEKPHSEFTRDGNDLIVTRRISVPEAFTGYTVHLTTLDGRNLTLPINDVIHPNYQKVVPNEGMPILGDPSKRGVLKIKFDIRFPTRINALQKAGMRRLFGP
ncbi:hypothetical protein Peur_066235 [Populus x canadensis]